MRLFRLAAVAAAGTFGFCAAAQAQTDGFTDRYLRMEPWWGLQCVSNGNIFGREPSTAGRFPVLVYLVGSFGQYDGTEALKFVDEAARRGFVAASFQYDYFWAPYPEGIDKNSGCMFDDSSSTSALAKLCARPKADCSKGVAVIGYSHGGAIAGRAANHSGKVRAAYLLGVSGPVDGSWSGYRKDAGGNVIPMAVGGPKGDRALPNDRIRITVGQADVAWSGTAALDAMTGQSCTGVTFNCIAPDGSGYYVVQDHEVADGYADHCFFQGGKWCTNTPPFDPGWLPPSELPWALGPALDWLAGRMTP